MLPDDLKDIARIALRLSLLVTSVVFGVCSLYQAACGNTVAWAAYGAFSWCLIEQSADIGRRDNK